LVGKEVNLLDFPEESKYDSKEYYNVNYTNIFTIFNTLLIMVTTNNTPDVALVDTNTNRMRVYTFFYIIISLFNLILASGIILAFVNEKYRQIFQSEINEFGSFSQSQIRLIESIKQIEQNKFSNYDEFEEFVISKYHDLLMQF
jgi:hypothetical protein